MKILFSLLFAVSSLNVFALDNVVPTQDHELHFTCVLNFTPFFVELDKNHQSGKLYLNNRIDEEGRGHSREFITSIRLADKRENGSHKFLTFKSPGRVKDFRSISLEVPKFMSQYFGMPDQLARIDLTDGSYLPGSCYVQFPAMAPQW